MMPATQPAGDQPIDHALALVDCGLRPVPIKPGMKYPPMKSWQNARGTVDEVRNWWNGLYRNHGVGLVMGPQPSGVYLVAIDIDTHNPAADGWEALHDLENIHGELPMTWRSLTGSGGAHILFAMPPGVTVRNQQASGNRIAPGIDVRGDGGQILVAPTIHPGTGHPYAWEHAPWETELAECPPWLVELVRERPVDPPRERLSTTDSPADLIRDRWDWRHELTAAGWTLTKDGMDSYWTRPGKNPRDGHSAVLHADQVLVVFTSELPPGWTTSGVRTVDGSGYSFSPFAFYAATRHQGDQQAAGRALRAEMAPERNSPTIRADDPEVGRIDPTVALEPNEDDWAPHDIADIAQSILDGTFTPEVPELLHVNGAMPLLYPGRIHSIFGPPGGGKTWVALAAIAERLQAGEHVLMIDYEDAPHGVAQRLVQLGCTPTETARLDYRNPSTSLLWGMAGGLEADQTPWTLVIIDSAGEALAAQGVELVDDAGTAAWFRLAKKFTVRPERPAVLMLDHVPKASGDEPAKYAIGSQRKLAAITGASYRVDAVKEFAKGRPGVLKLVVAKDRLGNRYKGATACEVHVDGGDERIALQFRLSDAQAAAEAGQPFRPTRLMENVSRWLEGMPGASRHEIEREVRGKNTAVRQAIDILVSEGWVTATPTGTHSTARVEHVVIRPFRELQPVDNSETEGASSPSSHLRPASSRTKQTPPQGASSPSSLCLIDRDEGTKLQGFGGDELRPEENGAVDNSTDEPEPFF